LKPAGMLDVRAPHPAAGHPLPVVEGISGYAGSWQFAVGSQQWGTQSQPKAESSKLKTLHLEPRTLYRHGEAAPLLQNKIMFT